MRYEQEYVDFICALTWLLLSVEAGRLVAVSGPDFLFRQEFLPPELISIINKQSSFVFSVLCRSLRRQQNWRPSVCKMLTKTHSWLGYPPVITHSGLPSHVFCFEVCVVLFSTGEYCSYSPKMYFFSSHMINIWYSVYIFVPQSFH